MKRNTKTKTPSRHFVVKGNSNIGHRLRGKRQGVKGFSFNLRITKALLHAKGDKPIERNN